MPEAEKKKILYAEDDAFFRQFLLRKLQGAGFEVDVAGDGQEALGKLEQGAYDLALLDLIMPKMNGFEVLERMRADGKSPTTPIVVLSSLDSQEDRDKVKALGAAEFLIKDLAANTILDSVKHFLGA